MSKGFRKVNLAKTLIISTVGLAMGPFAFSIDLKQFKFTDSYRYSFLDDTGFETFKYPSVLTLSFAHNHNPLYLTDSRSKSYVSSIVDAYDVADFGYSNRVFEDLTLSAETSFTTSKVYGNQSSTLGDIHLKAKYNLLKDKTSALSVTPILYVPTGNKTNFTTRESFGFGTLGIFEKHFDDVHLLAGMGFAHSPKNEYSIIDYKNLFLTQLGLSIDFNKNWNLNLEINRDFTFVTDYKQDAGNYFVTIKNNADELYALYAGFGLAGFTETDSKNWTAFAGIKLNFGTIQVPAVVQAPQPQPKPIIVKQEKPVIAKVEKPQIVKVIEQKPPTIVKQIIIIKSAEQERKLFGKAFALDNIYFANGKTEITYQERLKIDQILSKISENRKSINHIVIEGYASKVGGAKRNQELSLQRAKGVQAAFINGGITEELISIVAFGDRSKIVDKDINKNRKVQFRVYLKK